MFLIGSAGLLLTMLPVVAVELKYQFSLLTGINQPVVPTPTLFPTQPPGPKDEEEAFSIDIPKISATSVVIPNVDAGDPSVYTPALQKGVAHALGTGLPGTESRLNRTIYLFAHSTSAPSLVTRYNAQFYLLHKLEAGDGIDVTFWAQNYRYRVRETKIVEANDVSWLEPQTQEELLVLATCTPPGTTWKRLLVIAERVSDAQ
jgi:sortase A